MRRSTRVPPVASIGLLPERAAERLPHVAIVTDRPADVRPDIGLRLDYAGLARLVEEASGWLHAAGVEPWDRVAIMKRNHPDILILACAAARIGAIPTLLSPRLDRAAVHTLLARLERPVLLADVERIEAGGLDRDAIVELTKRTLVVDGVEDGAVALDDVRGERPPPAAPRLEDEPMVITHTSGTTGVPKLVQHSARTIQVLARVETRRWPVFGLRRDDICGVCLSYVHGRSITGLSAVLTVGAPLVMLSEPDHDNVRSMFVHHRPSVVETHPNIYLYWEPLTEEPDGAFASARIFVNTFDAMHPRTIRKMLAASRRRFPVWAQGWGQSETGPVTLRAYTRRSLRRRGARSPVSRNVGRPLPLMTRVRIVDPATGARVRRGEMGLLEVSTPGRCLGYLGEDDRFGEKQRDGWWNMGDMGARTRSGAVRLLDREVDRLAGASGIELEDVLLDRIDELSEAIVLGVPGRPPVPVVSTHRDAQLDRRAWAAATADLPPLDEPVQIPWEEFPRTATWKVRRFLLREKLFPGAVPVGTGRWT